MSTALADDVDRALQKATLGGGCFWCLEAAYTQLEGVQRVVSGYMGGTVPHPTYEQVCTGDTGHAEVVQVEFDPAVITFAELLDWFWKVHDPTQLNRQGADVGTQYRSVIFCHDAQQLAAAKAARDQVEKARVFTKPLVTQIVQAETFYPAEDYHQAYYTNNPNAGYCRFVIAPKLKKLGLQD